MDVTWGKIADGSNHSQKWNGKMGKMAQMLSSHLSHDDDEWRGK